MRVSTRILMLTAALILLGAGCGAVGDRPDVAEQRNEQVAETREEKCAGLHTRAGTFVLTAADATALLGKEWTDPEEKYDLGICDITLHPYMILPRSGVKYKSDVAGLTISRMPKYIWTGTENSIDNPEAGGGVFEFKRVSGIGDGAFLQYGKGGKPSAGWLYVKTRTDYFTIQCSLVCDTEEQVYSIGRTVVERSRR